MSSHHMSYQNSFKEPSLNLSHLKNQKTINYKCLFVKNLPHDMLQQDLQFLFSVIGQIKSARIIQKFENTEEISTWGYVQYKHQNDAAKALTKFNNRNFGVRTLFVKYYQRKNYPHSTRGEKSRKSMEKPLLDEKQQDYNFYKQPKKYVKIDQTQPSSFNKCSKVFTQHKQMREQNPKNDKVYLSNPPLKNYKSLIQQKEKDKASQIISKYEQAYYQKKRYDDQQTIYHSNEDVYDY